MLHLCCLTTWVASSQLCYRLRMDWEEGTTKFQRQPNFEAFAMMSECDCILAGDSLEAKCLSLCEGRH
jgi:hypothetical protein